MNPSTPLPWKAWSENVTGDTVTRDIFPAAGGGYAIASGFRNDEDLEYAVKAANAFPKLVEALKKARPILGAAAAEAKSGQLHELRKRIYEQVEAALKEAGGG